jgi:uncharacterized membrane protein
MSLILSIIIILSLIVIGFFVVAVMIQKGMTRDAEKRRQEALKKGEPPEPENPEMMR